MTTNAETEKQRLDNAASWQSTIRFFDHVMENAVRGDRCLPLLRLVRLLAGSPHAQEFRAGQSVFDLIISTKSRHGLDVDDHRVRVSVNWADDILRVEYWLGGEAGDLAERHSVDESGLLDVLEPVLNRLRAEVRREDG